MAYTIIKNKINDTINGVLAHPSSITICVQKIKDIMLAESTYSPSFESMGINKMVGSSIIINNIISAANYQNVLVIPSFKNSDFPTLLSADDILSPIISSNTFPIINKHFGCSPDIYVAYPDEHQSFVRRLNNGFGVNIISSNKMYAMGDEDYTITSPILFDAVVLGVVPVNTDETFLASDIKNDFAQYCTPEFDLIDIQECMSDVLMPIRLGNDWGEEKVRLVGETKDFTEIFEHINSNTFPKDHFYDEYTRDKLAPVLSKGLNRLIKVY